MKNLIIFGFFVMILIFVQFAQAQTVEDIIKKNIEAMGGQHKLAALKTVRMEGKLNTQDNDLPLKINIAQGTGLRVDLEDKGTVNYQVANTNSGKLYLPAKGMDAPAEMPAGQFRAAQLQMDIQGALFNYPAKGTTVEWVGAEEVGGRAANKLKLRLSDGTICYYFLDAKTYRLLRSAVEEMQAGKPVLTETNYSDYHQDDNGYWFPYTVSNPMGTMVFETITTNIKLDENIFKD